ncbi:MAG: hypothetical protein B7Z62_09070, partial [Deltaproteobacteria bacterium 37-65-8]
MDLRHRAGVRFRGAARPDRLQRDRVLVGREPRRLRPGDEGVRAGEREGGPHPLPRRFRDGGGDRAVRRGEARLHPPG